MAANDQQKKTETLTVKTGLRAGSGRRVELDHMGGD